MDGRDVTGLGLGAISYLLRQPIGTKVTLTLQAPSGERRTIAMATVKP